MAAIVQACAEAGRPHPQEHVWRVIHACDSIRSVSDLIEAQIAAGMRPFVLTGEVTQRNASLLETWASVRGWKRCLEQSDGISHPLQASIIHAHTFASAMAGLRAGLATVYDARAFVDDFAIVAEQCTERSWLARSFRAAEDFVLPRAGAVVVHSSLMRDACRKRGVGKEDLFLVPTPMLTVPAPDKGWLRRAFDFRDDVVTIFARPNITEDETLMRAFAQVAAEVPGARLFIAADREQTQGLRRFAHQSQIDELVFFLAPEDQAPALQAADIVLAGWPVFPDDSPWGRVTSITIAASGTALTAMANGCCLLAADCSAHRDLTPEGRGCLWFGTDSESKDRALDLAHRMAFLARNADFRKALAESGRQHLDQTRGPERIGQKYRDIYRHAHLRRNRGDDAPGQKPILVPNQASV